MVSAELVAIIAALGVSGMDFLVNCFAHCCSGRTKVVLGGDGAKMRFEHEGGDVSPAASPPSPCVHASPPAGGNADNYGHHNSGFTTPPNSIFVAVEGDPKHPIHVSPTDLRSMLWQQMEGGGIEDDGSSYEYYDDSEQVLVVNNHDLHRISEQLPVPPRRHFGTPQAPNIRSASHRRFRSNTPGASGSVVRSRLSANHRDSHSRRTSVEVSPRRILERYAAEDVAEDDGYPEDNGYDQSHVMPTELFRTLFHAA
jgi:hypothetical protein